MNSLKLFSAAIVMVLLSLIVAPGSDATGIWIPIHPWHVFTAAKLKTMAIIKKGAILGGIAVPLAAKQIILGKAAVVGAKGGILASGLKAPLFLAKSALPNLLSLAPLLKGLGKKTKARTLAPEPIAAPTPAPTLPPPPPTTPAYGPPAAPAYEPHAAPAYGPPAAPVYVAPAAPTYATSYIQTYHAPPVMVKAY